MKKLIFLALTTLMMGGCDYETKEQNRVDGFDVIVVDSCEYLKKEEGGGYLGYGFLAHKGNCKYCAERRQKELEELVIKLKEK